MLIVLVVVVVIVHWVVGSCLLWVVVVVVMVVVMVIVMVIVIVMVVPDEGVSLVVEPCVSAGQDISAGTDHVWGEGELLAVEDEEFSVLSQGLVALSAAILEVMNSVLLVMDLVVVLTDADPVVVVVDLVVVLGDAFVVGRDAVFEVVNVVVKFDKCISHGFERDHQRSLRFESLLVVWLLPDLMPLIEVVDLTPEVTGWDVTVEICVVVMFIVEVLDFRGGLRVSWLVVVLGIVVIVVVSGVAVAIAVVVGVVDLAASVVAVVVGHSEGDVRRHLSR